MQYIVTFMRTKRFFSIIIILLSVLCGGSDETQPAIPGSMPSDGISNVYIVDNEFYYSRNDGALYKVCPDGEDEPVDRFSNGNAPPSDQREEIPAQNNESKVLYEDERFRILKTETGRSLQLEDRADGSLVSVCDSEDEIRCAAIIGDILYCISDNRHLMELPVDAVGKSDPIWNVDAGKYVWLQPWKENGFCLRVVTKNNAHYLEAVLLAEDGSLTGLGVSDVIYESFGSLHCIIDGDSYIFATGTCPNVCCGTR